MNLKVVAGIVLFFAGLGLGVWEWIWNPLALKFPTLGLICCGVGVYLIASGLVSRGRGSGVGTLASIAAPVVGFALGQIAYEKLKETYLSPQARITPEQIDEIERTTDRLFREGRLTPEKYVRMKKLIQELRARAR